MNSQPWWTQQTTNLGVADTDCAQQDERTQFVTEYPVHNSPVGLRCGMRERLLAGGSGMRSHPTTQAISKRKVLSRDLTLLSGVDGFVMHFAGARR